MHRRQCMNDIPADTIEKKRNSLRHSFYSIQRRMTEEEMRMVLVPLFQDVSLEISMMKTRVVINVNNKVPEDVELNSIVLEMINDWNVHDEFRRFIVKGLSVANKKGIYKYSSDMTWKCPLSVHYTPKSDEDEYEEGDIVI